MKLSKLRKELTKEYKYKIEMHAHTSPMSSCGHLPPEEVVELYHQKGYSAIAITNHFSSYSMNLLEGFTKETYIDAVLNETDRAKKAALKYGMTVYDGCELRFDENSNDYLIYGVDRKILGVCYDYFQKGLVAFRTEVPLKKSVFIQAHPFRKGIELVDSKLLDGFEILNLHPGHNGAVGLSTKYAYDENIKIKIAGSDFHDTIHLATTALLAKDLPKDTSGLIKLLKSGDYILEIGENAIVIP